MNCKQTHNHTGEAIEQTHEADLLKSFELRKIIEQVVDQEHVTDDSLEAAQDTIQIIIKQGERYGFTQAEVLKALLSPVFSPRPRCGCASCRARRTQQDV